MTEALFFPKKREHVDVTGRQQAATQTLSTMHDYLHSQVEEGEVKLKLHDQLLWLQHQIRYFTHSHDLDHLIENFNWVVANFNHDLRLLDDKAFSPLSR